MDYKQIDLYLNGEMSEQEREKFEEQFVDNERLFYEIVERENELVDLYASGGLAPEMRERFERSLSANPARLQKVANAGALREFIAVESENKPITLAERSGFFSRLAGMFAFNSPALQFASAAVIVLFALWSTYLLVENRRLHSLEQDLASARGREAELQSQVESAQEDMGDLAAALDGERQRIKDLEADIAKLKPNGGGNTGPQTSIPSPTIATVLLGATLRDGRPLVPRLELPSSATRVSIVIDLPAEAGERVSVKLNGSAAGDNLRVQDRFHTRRVSVTLPTSRLQDGRNTVEILDSAGGKIDEHAFSTVRK